SDDLMWTYFTLLSFRSLDDIAQLKAECAGGRNPRDAKVLLGQEIVTRVHGAAAVQSALDDFNNRARGGIPDDIPEVTLTVPAEGLGI
ncbi:tyrosine--tRNA ligase, partial [Acinetobacter baumannii]